MMKLSGTVFNGTKKPVVRKPSAKNSNIRPISLGTTGQECIIEKSFRIGLKNVLLRIVLMASAANPAILSHSSRRTWALSIKQILHDLIIFG